MNFQTLIVDDDEIFNMLSKKMIQRCGFHSSPQAFTNGELALEYLQVHYNMDEIFVIFLDINMPVMNGWDFLEQITKFIDRSNTHIFMVTSSIDDSDYQRASESDYILKYLPKPVLTEDLIDLMELPEIKPFFQTT